MKTAQDVIAEWVVRGYLTQEDADANLPKHLSYIGQAKDAILAYCNIPLGANIPDGLFYAWVEISHATGQGTLTVSGTGQIKSVSEGDTTVSFDVGTTTVKLASATVDYTAALNRFRRMP